MKPIGRASKWIATFGAVSLLALAPVSGSDLIHKVDGASAPAPRTDIDWPSLEERRTTRATRL